MIKKRDFFAALRAAFKNSSITLNPEFFNTNIYYKNTIMTMQVFFED